MAVATRTKKRAVNPATGRVMNVRRDTLDFRDLMYTPTLVEVPAYRKLEDYQQAGVPVLDQGRQGACTGFGLATVVHYLLRTHRIVPEKVVVSPFMLYDMARRYDDWPGEKYEGSSCRGAMKGWFKHGVCEMRSWPKSRPGSRIDHGSAEDAAHRPLGAYYRVNHCSLVAMHAAITEAGVLYASASVHSGWNEPAPDGTIPLEEEMLGGHAFAIVAYDEDGFWIQNSWGEQWGRKGFGRILYDDWLRNGTDAWVARLGVPVRLTMQDGAKPRRSMVGAVRAKTWSYADLRPHVINIGDHGRLDPRGDIGTTPEMVEEIFSGDFPRITSGWKRKRIVVYAHGGLVAQDDALQRVNEYRDAMLAKECYPLAFIWNSDFWTTVKELLDDAAAQRRPEGFLGDAKDFMLDRLDDMLEPVARCLGGPGIWSKMKENALGATSDSQGGARLVAAQLAKLAADPAVELHFAAHSAGSIFHAALLQLLASKGKIAAGPMRGETGLGVAVKTCTLWAPAATTALFRDCYLPLVQAKAIGRLALFLLDDQTEQDDNCASIYHKSLLYLVSNALEDHAHVPLERDGEPIVGMKKFVDADAAINALFQKQGGASLADLVVAPNDVAEYDPGASKARHHGDFDDDPRTLYATLARILGGPAQAAAAPLVIRTGTSRKREIRRSIDGMPDFAATR